MNDETQNNNIADNNTPDQQVNVTDIQRVDQSIPPIENGGKKIPFFVRKKIGGRLTLYGIILAVVLFTAGMFFTVAAMMGGPVSYDVSNKYMFIFNIFLMAGLACVSLSGLGLIIKFISSKYSENPKQASRYAGLLLGIFLFIFPMLIIFNGFGDLNKYSAPQPKPKSENAILKELQSVSGGDIKSISNFKEGDNPSKDGYMYSGVYYIKGLNARIDFTYNDLFNGQHNYSLSDFIFDGSTYDLPFEKNPYFKSYALYKTYFKNDSGWKSFEDFYNQTGEAKLGMIDRTIDLADNMNNEFDLKTIKVDGHPFNEVLAVSSDISCRDDNATCKVYIIYFDKSLNSWKLITDNYKNRFNLLSN